MRWIRARSNDGRDPREVWQEWLAADEAGDAARAGRLAVEMTEVDPDSAQTWFHAGLYSKARGDWAESARRNARAVELFTPDDEGAFDGVNPAAWNLGIAATALRDWATARRAWRAYGVQGVEDGDGPVDQDFGVVPVRVNPDRPSLPHQVVPDLGSTETVWCWRRSPAHAVVSSVPLPQSGHRFRDVLLHDGEPKGSRRLGDREVPVFDELARLEDSGLPTWQAEVLGADQADLDALAEVVGSRGLGADDWTAMPMLCSDCSHGSPGSPGTVQTHEHTHEPTREDAVRVGLAGGDDEVRASLDEWLDGRPGVVLGELTLLW